MSQRRVQASRYRIFDRRPLDWKERPYFEGAGGTLGVRSDDADVQVNCSRSEVEYRLRAAEQNSDPAGSIVDPVGVHDLGSGDVQQLRDVFYQRLFDGLVAKERGSRERQAVGRSTKWDQAGPTFLQHDFGRG
jgi:hypothetical protein